MKRAHITLGTVILALEVLFVVPVVRATESPEIDASKGVIGEPFASLAFAR